MIKPTNDIPEKSEIEIVATQKTKTVSGKSDLTYHLGKDEIANAYGLGNPFQPCRKNSSDHRSVLWYRSRHR